MREEWRELPSELRFFIIGMLVIMVAGIVLALTPVSNMVLVIAIFGADAAWVFFCGLLIMTNDRKKERR